MSPTNSRCATATASAFSMGDDGPIGAAVDFLQEIGNAKKLVFKLVRPLHIEEAPGPDVAFFEIEVVSGDSQARQADRACRTGR